MKKSLSFSSNIKNLDLAERFVNTICEYEEIDERFFGNIMIAITEGVTNAIEHGNKNDTSKKVELYYMKSGPMLSFVVTDQGSGFDPDKLPDPTLPENLEKETGRGIFLMKSLADEIVFDNEGRKVEIKFDVKGE